MIVVFRYGHRPERDKRVSTHVCLVARAFGADKVVFDRKDDKIKENIEKIAENWGGNFKIEFVNSYKKYIKEFKKSGGIVVHLTMYGLKHIDVVEDIKKFKDDRDILIIVGSEKVPRDIYELADYNVAIGNQPHSEISALAILLYDLDRSKLYRDLENAKLKIVPSVKDKVVKTNNIYKGKIIKN